MSMRAAGSLSGTVTSSTVNYYSFQILAPISNTFNAAAQVARARCSRFASSSQACFDADGARTSWLEQFGEAAEKNARVVDSQEGWNGILKLFGARAAATQ
jgi:hypothetical protein